MAEASETAMWFASGGASVVFLAWAMVQLAIISRRTGARTARSWFSVFILAMVALALAGMAGAALGRWAAPLEGAALAVGGYGLYKALYTGRLLLEAGYGA